MFLFLKYRVTLLIFLYNFYIMQLKIYSMGRLLLLFPVLQIYIHTYICIYTYIYIHTHTYICIYTYIYIYICIYTYIYIHTHIYIYTHIYMYIHIYIYTHTHIYIYTHIYVYTHIYIQTISHTIYIYYGKTQIWDKIFFFLPLSNPSSFCHMLLILKQSFLMPLYPEPSMRDLYTTVIKVYHPGDR